MLREIVGVAEDIRYLTKRPQDSVEIYLPYAQKAWPAIYVVARTGRRSYQPGARGARRAA